MQAQTCTNWLRIDLVKKPEYSEPCSEQGSETASDRAAGPEPAGAPACSAPHGAVLCYGGSAGTTGSGAPQERGLGPCRPPAPCCPRGVWGRAPLLRGDTEQQKGGKLPSGNTQLWLMWHADISSYSPPLLLW